MSRRRLPRAARQPRRLVLPPEPRRCPTWNPPGQSSIPDAVDRMIRRWREEDARRGR